MRLMLRKCNCDWELLRRVHRELWMHLFPGRRLYYCTKCQARVFAFKRLIEGSPHWTDAATKIFIRKVMSHSPPQRAR